MFNKLNNLLKAIGNFIVTAYTYDLPDDCDDLSDEERDLIEQELREREHMMLTMMMY